MRFPTPSEEEETWPLDKRTSCGACNDRLRNFFVDRLSTTVSAARDVCQAPTSSAPTDNATAQRRVSMSNTICRSDDLTGRISN
jgi:hypothetical protein